MNGQGTSLGKQKTLTTLTVAPIFATFSTFC